MSKFVDDIITDLKENPESFVDNGGYGVTKGKIKTAFYGNSALLSLISVYINGKEMPLVYKDKYKLELAIKRWYRNISLSHLTKQKLI